MSDTPVTTTRLRVSFDIDMARYLPRSLKPHDYTLDVWARQAVFDLFFKQLEVDALNRKLDIIRGDPDVRERRLADLEHDIALYRAAISAFTVEVLPELEPGVTAPPQRRVSGLSANRTELEE